MQRISDSGHQCPVTGESDTWSWRSRLSRLAPFTAFSVRSGLVVGVGRCVTSSRNSTPATRSSIVRPTVMHMVLLSCPANNGHKWSRPPERRGFSQSSENVPRLKTSATIPALGDWRNIGAIFLGHDTLDSFLCPPTHFDASGFRHSFFGRLTHFFHSLLPYLLFVPPKPHSISFSNSCSAARAFLVCAPVYLAAPIYRLCSR